VTRTYTSAAAFKQALEDRLKRDAMGGFALQRRRQSLVFQRFLARVQTQLGTAILKGGFALEIRLEHARSTRDVDLVLHGSSISLLERLRAAGQLDLGDFMTFEIQERKHAPDVVGDGVRYGGKRYTVECKLAGKVYGARFGADIVFGGPMQGEPAIVTGDDFLGFAGMEPPRFLVLPAVTHIAEKLHAYTLPRPTANDRFRDLPDLALLATARESLTCRRISAALVQTFEYRGTHDVPRSVPPPPPAWRDVYAEMASEHELEWKTLEEVFGAVTRFLDPVLAMADGDGDMDWDRGSWLWVSGHHRARRIQG
jgi:hypothetical protein